MFKFSLPVRTKASDLARDSCTITTTCTIIFGIDFIIIIIATARSAAYF